MASGTYGKVQYRASTGQPTITAAPAEVSQHRKVDPTPNT
jgi:hypothetical protein